ncbi:MAG TPA: DinB family protein, partial [Oceanobacillus sp.]|nr:DinB family protein [Oceanobacillus sp.]
MASRQDYIKKLREFPEQLEARVKPLTDEQLDQREAEGEWSTRQIVHHLADSHMSANFRFRLPLSEPPIPRLPTYD